jgi:copper chaperone for superoxide dismutase
MSGKGCENVIRKSLAEDVTILEINADNGRVLVETKRPWTEIKEQMEKTGKNAVLTGFGGRSAVAIVDKGQAKGVIRFCSINEKQGVVVDGVLDGLQPKTKHVVNVHEFGDVSSGCQSVGDVYGQPEKEVLVTSDESGRTTFRFLRTQLTVPEIIGRSVVVRPANAAPEQPNQMACGIIARAAGIFQNYKKICACDGVTIWDERNRPVAGAGRRDV